MYTVLRVRHPQCSCKSFKISTFADIIQYVLETCKCSMSKVQSGWRASNLVILIINKVPRRAKNSDILVKTKPASALAENQQAHQSHSK